MPFRTHPGPVGLPELEAVTPFLNYDDVNEKEAVSQMSQHVNVKRKGGDSR